jgi:hypothetical protein
MPVPIRHAPARRGPIRLANGYRIEPCGCGGAIAALDVDRYIESAVRAHQRTPHHAAWAASRLGR